MISILQSLIWPSFAGQNCGKSSVFLFIIVQRVVFIVSDLYIAVLTIQRQKDPVFSKFMNNSG